MHDQIEHSDIKLSKLVNITENICVRWPGSVDAVTIDPMKDIQVYCTANKCNSTKKPERVTLK